MPLCNVLTVILLFCGATGAAAAETGSGIERVSLEDRRQVREAVAEVLAQPEFRRVRDDSRSWAEWLAEHLNAALLWLRDRLWGLPGWLSWFIVIWMVLTVVAILAHLVFVLASQFGVGGSRQTGHRRDEGRICGIQNPDFDAVFAEAQRQLEARHWAAAVRYLYVAAILWLDQRGMVRFRAAKTNRDYLNELTTHAGAQQHFRVMTSTFDRVVYGGAAPSESTCRTMAATLESLQSEVRSANKT